MAAPAVAITARHKVIRGASEYCKLDLDPFLDFNRLTLYSVVASDDYIYNSALCHPAVNCIFNFWHSGTLALRAERQSARMSEIKNVG